LNYARSRVTLSNPRNSCKASPLALEIKYEGSVQASGESALAKLDSLAHYGRYRDSIIEHARLQLERRR